MTATEILHAIGGFQKHIADMGELMQLQMMESVIEASNGFMTTHGLGLMQGGVWSRKTMFNEFGVDPIDSTMTTNGAEKKAKAQAMLRANCVRVFPEF